MVLYACLTYCRVLYNELEPIGLLRAFRDKALSGYRGNQTVGVQVRWLLIALYIHTRILCIVNYQVNIQSVVRALIRDSSNQVYLIRMKIVYVPAVKKPSGALESDHWTWSWKRKLRGTKNNSKLGHASLTKLKLKRKMILQWTI